MKTNTLILHGYDAECSGCGYKTPTSWKLNMRELTLEKCPECKQAFTHLDTLFERGLKL